MASPRARTPADEASITLREYYEARLSSLERIIDEHDKRYAELRADDKRALDAALAAAEKAVAAAATASEKAILKSEEAQRGVNERGNEFRGSLDDYTKTMMPRAESLALFKSMEDKIARVEISLTNTIDSLKKDIGTLQLASSNQTGTHTGSREVWLALIAVAGVAAGFVGVLTRFFH
jgi:hypothetical protein